MVPDYVFPVSRNGATAASSTVASLCSIARIANATWPAVRSLASFWRILHSAGANGNAPHMHEVARPRLGLNRAPGIFLQHPKSHLTNLSGHAVCSTVKLER